MDISVGEISPTLDVALTPVGTTVQLISRVKLPTLDVALTPVMSISSSGTTVNDPKLELNAVNPDSWTSLLNESP